MNLDRLTSGSKDGEGYGAAQRALLGAAVHWINDQSRQFLVGVVIQSSNMPRLDPADGPRNIDKALEKIPRLLGTGTDRGGDHKGHGKKHARDRA